MQDWWCWCGVVMVEKYMKDDTCPDCDTRTERDHYGSESSRHCSGHLSVAGPSPWVDSKGIALSLTVQER
ncbi:NAD-dependent DNA ligase LigA [Sesbania bispinosa]|nr:NAD-dependent DNA ligase LigA [Sesbania bispinosa]